MRRFVAFAGLLIEMTAHGSQVWAALGDPRGFSPATVSEAAHASVVYVADAVSHDDLFALITELLGRESVDCDITTASRFDADDLFAPAGGVAAVRVFVRIDGTSVAHLYFRGPGGQRFLLRTITLPNCLDDVGRELIGQVVASSVIALLRSSTGMSREQASSELAREFRDTPQSVAARPRPSRVGLPALTPENVAYFMGLRYASRYAGPDLAMEHGPGVNLSVGRRQVPMLRARFTLERDFRQTVSNADLAIHVQTYSLRFSVDYVVHMLQTQAICIGFGAGVDWAHLSPGAPHADAVIPLHSRVDRVMILRPELRYEVAFQWLRLGVASFTDIADSRTHYLLAGTDPPKQIASPWQLRPGIALILGPSW